jgi:hypothetical protein
MAFFAIKSSLQAPQSGQSGGLGRADRSREKQLLKRINKTCYPVAQQFFRDFVRRWTVQASLSILR